MSDGYNPVRNVVDLKKTASGGTMFVIDGVPVTHYIKWYKPWIMTRKIWPTSSLLPIYMFFQKVSHDLNNEKVQRILRIIIGFPS